MSISVSPDIPTSLPPSAGSVTDAAVSASAALSWAKMAALSDGQVVIGNGGIPSAASISGNGSVTKAGVLTVTGATGDFKGVGKFGVHNTAPASQNADTGTANEAVVITLLTEVAGALNAQALHINDLRKCLRDHGLMA